MKYFKYYAIAIASGSMEPKIYKGDVVVIVPILEASDLEMKYRDGSQFVAKTLDDQGNIAPNQQVSFNINGILYSRTTNDDGEAGITINLPAGEYIITTEYGYEKKSNNVKIEA